MTACEQPLGSLTTHRDRDRTDTETEHRHDTEPNSNKEPEPRALEERSGQVGAHSSLDAAIETLEEALCRLKAQRDDLASLRQVGEPSDKASLPFRAIDMLEAGEAACRFGINKDTVRLWCRQHGIGEKRGGRWWVSIPHLEAEARRRV